MSIRAGQGPVSVRVPGGESAKLVGQIKTAPGVGCVNNRPDSQGLARRLEGAPN